MSDKSVVLSSNEKDLLGTAIYEIERRMRIVCGAPTVKLEDDQWRALLAAARNAHETGEPRCTVCSAPLTVSVVCSDRCARRANELKANAQKAVVKRCPKCNRDVTEGCNYCACPYPQATPSSEGSVGG